MSERYYLVLEAADASEQEEPFLAVTSSYVSELNGLSHAGDYERLICCLSAAFHPSTDPSVLVVMS